MKYPLFDNDIMCVRCSNWYTPIASVDDAQLCSTCRIHKKQLSKQPHGYTAMKKRLRSLIATFGNREDQSFVYMLMGEKTRMVKIGYTTTDPLQRLTACQTGSPDILRYLGSFWGTLALEQEMHTLLKPFHSHGEWFKIPSGLLRILIQHMNVKVYTPDFRDQ